MGVREEVLRDLVTEYQPTRSPIVFEKILMRVDKLLLKTLHMMIKSRPYLATVGAEDIYQTEIVGLYRALDTVLPTEDGGHIVARIIAYIRAEVKKDYPYRHYGKVKLFSEIEDEEGQICCTGQILTSKQKEWFEGVPDDRVENNAEFSLLFERISELVNSGKLTYEHLGLLKKHFFDGKTTKEIAQEKGCSRQNIEKQLNKVLLIVQKDIKTKNDVIK
jgi:RNA polymerase sigma factor (sigma-70 family)